MKNNKTRWTLVAIVAAIVAVATTALVLILRARAKKKAWYEEEAIDLDEYDTLNAEDAIEVDAAEEIEE